MRNTTQLQPKPTYLTDRLAARELLGKMAINWGPQITLYELSVSLRIIAEDRKAKKQLYEKIADITLDAALKVSKEMDKYYRTTFI